MTRADIPDLPEPAPATPASGDASFRLLIDSVRDYAIFQISPSGDVLTWNPGAERIKGYSAEEIIGRNFRIFYSPEAIAAGHPDQELREAAELGRYEEEGWRVRKDGQRFRAHVVMTALRDDSGELLGFAKVTQDVTARYEAERALRESEERFRILVEQVSDYSIFMLDPDGRIATWNRGAERIKGYRAYEVIGRPLAIFYTPEDRAIDRVGTLLAAARAAGVAHDIGWRMRKDGSRFWADVTLTALHDADGRLCGFSKVVRDLTERVEAEELAKAYAAAQHAIDARDEFLSIAAHELRTPLTAAQLQLQGLRRHLRRDPEQWERDRLLAGVHLALESGERLSQLVESLLDVSRIATGRIRLNLDEFDLAELIASGVARLHDMVAQAGCRVVLDATPGLVGCWDPLRIEQILMNLIANACKYAPGTTIDVGLERAEDKIRLTVRDRGPGIAPEHAGRIFERFERAVPVSHYGGMGLGLYVTRQIAELHGGTIELETGEGKGSTFVVELPLRPEPQPGAVGPE